MEFRIDKYTILIMKKWKGETMEWTELPKQESIRTSGEEKKLQMRILNADTIK